MNEHFKINSQTFILFVTVYLKKNVRFNSFVEFVSWALCFANSKLKNCLHLNNFYPQES